MKKEHLETGFLAFTLSLFSSITSFGGVAVNNYDGKKIKENSSIESELINNSRLHSTRADGMPPNGEILEHGGYTFSVNSVNQATATAAGLEGDLLAEADSNTSRDWSYLEQGLTLINSERANAGLAPLVLDRDLSVAASYRNGHMIRYNYYSHTYNGVYVARDVIAGVLGFAVTSSENLYKGYSNQLPSEPRGKVVELGQKAYMASDSHRANILRADATRVGLAITVVPRGNGVKDFYYTMLFI